jgi:hypothetical protein
VYPADFYLGDSDTALDTALGWYVALLASHYHLEWRNNQGMAAQHESMPKSSLGILASRI